MRWRCSRDVEWMPARPCAAWVPPSLPSSLRPHSNARGSGPSYLTQAVLPIAKASHAHGPYGQVELPAHLTYPRDPHSICTAAGCSQSGPWEARGPSPSRTQGQRAIGTGGPPELTAVGCSMAHPAPTTACRSCAPTSRSHHCLPPAKVHVTDWACLQVRKETVTWVVYGGPAAFSGR